MLAGGTGLEPSLWRTSPTESQPFTAQCHGISDSSCCITAFRTNDPKPAAGLPTQVLNLMAYATRCQAGLGVRLQKNINNPAPS
jgi:hypothetical protein